MSLRIERALKRRKTEIFITLLLFVLAISLVILSLGPLQEHLSVRLGEKVAFAMIVALVVRWITVGFSEAEHTEDSDDNEYHEAIKMAREKIWICQTWLPGIDRDATEILQTKASNIRILLASFKEGSPIYARIAGRRKKVLTGKTNVESSVRPFIDSGNKDCIRFNYSHHPGWIAIIDSFVFWGPTPVHVDNHSIDFLFHKHLATSAKGAFWTTQFQLLWDHHSHNFDTEMEFNEELRELDAK